MSKRLKGLIIDFPKEDIVMFNEMLGNKKILLDYSQVKDIDHIHKSLKSNQWDLIICNFDSLSINGLEVLEILNELKLDTPLIFLSKVYDSKVALEMMTVGVHDFIGKDDLQKFVHAIHRVHGLKSLREEKDRYYKLVNQSVQGMIIITESSPTIVFSNQTLQSIVELSENEISDMTLEEILEMTYPDDKDSILTNCMNLIQCIGPVQDVEFRILRSNNSLVWVHLNSRQIHYQGQPAFLVSFIDITERRYAEDQLRQERNRAQSYLDIAGVIIIALDINGKVTLVNQKGCELLGLKNRDIIGKDWIEVFTPLRNRRNLKRVFGDLRKGNQEQNEYIELPILTSSGEERIIAWHNTVITNSQGKIVGTLSSGEDITTRKRAEETMKAAAETAMLYVDLMGHDIRNHLQTVVMGTDILRHYEIDAEAEPIFNMIIDSVTNSRKLIAKVQATRGFLSAPLRTISLTDSLLQAVTLITQSFEDVKVNAKYEVLDAKIRADEYIRQLWLNLLENAVVHNIGETKWIWVSLSEKFECYQILIGDNGSGIDDEKKEALFDPNRRFGGIGVHQAMKIVQKYNGNISVRNRVVGDHTQGAEFHIWFPRIDNRRLTGIAV
jgi:PAS domain S-box-containing protein